MTDLPDAAWPTVMARQVAHQYDIDRSTNTVMIARRE